MITLTAEQAQQIEEALHNVGNALMCLTATRKLRPMYQEMRDDAVDGCNKALATIRAARAQELNLNCKSVQKRLATVWGYVKAEQTEQPNTQFMEGYRIGLAEMREKCATVSEQGTGEAVQKAALELLLNERKRIAAAIRSIKFEGDKGFRPVSEMVAEHKKDPKKKAAIERAELRKQVAALKAVVDAWNNVEREPSKEFHEWAIAEHEKLKQAEQEPMACPYPCGWDNLVSIIIKSGAYLAQTLHEDEPITDHQRQEVMRIISYARDLALQGKRYAAPVRTKDLTDDEICEALETHSSDIVKAVRAAIAAFKEKNK